MGEWTQAALRLQRSIASLEGIQLTAIFGLIAVLLLIHPLRGVEIGRVLLLVYWALNLPVLAQDITTLARQYPFYRNVTLRLLDPLGAAEEAESEPRVDNAQADAAPSLVFRDVSVQASGHTILEAIDLEIEAGTHVAVVGPSGAGKSSLVGLLLGWLKPSQGSIIVNGNPLDCEQLRRFTAWVDPAVQLWNRSLAANLSYGSSAGASELSTAIDTALLRNVLESLPSGLQTSLGEGGALVSGGEGQRVRLGRAMLRSDVRLVILDEPFRGLDRDKRRELLARARQFWQQLHNSLHHPRSLRDRLVRQSSRYRRRPCRGRRRAQRIVGEAAVPVCAVGCRGRTGTFGNLVRQLLASYPGALGAGRRGIASVRR